MAPLQLTRCLLVVFSRGLGASCSADGRVEPAGVGPPWATTEALCRKQIPGAGWGTAGGSVASLNKSRSQAAGISRAVGDAVGPKAEDIANRSKAAGADAVAGVARHG